MADDDVCPICCNSYNLKTTLPDCPHSFCFLCIKGVFLHGGTCPLCRQPIPEEIFNQPALNQEDYGLSYSREGRSEIIAWCYEARDGRWWLYSEKDSQDIEESHSRGLTQMEMLIAGHIYCIDFVDSCQYQQYDRHQTSRRILRICLDQGSFRQFINTECKGIAGLLFSNMETSSVNRNDVR